MNALRPMLRESWGLAMLVAVAVLVNLPGLLDADVVKTAAAALVLAVVVLPWMLFGARDDVAAWFTSTGGRLFVAGTSLAAVGAAEVLTWAPTVDRLLLFAVANAAAVLGARAAARTPRALTAVLAIAGAITALVAVAQALGWERSLTPGPEEIVGLAGNSTRAGALLALVVPMLAADLLAETAPSPRAGRLGRAALIVLVVTALLLTLARGARLAAMLGMVTVLGVALRSWAPVQRRRALRVGTPVLVGVLAVAMVLALVLGGGDVLVADKLPDDGSLVAGTDLTMNVRLALWRGSFAMALDAPLLGWGLGRFPERFVPFREPGEAALPGLGGAATTAEHPHNEWLLALVEGGWLGGLITLLLITATAARLRHRLAEVPDADEAGLCGLLVAGLVLGMVQDAWTSPTTAVPLFAALGYAWSPLPSPRTGHGRERPSIVLTLTTLALAVALAGASVPRLQAHLLLKRFHDTSAVLGIDVERCGLLLDAADADPTDVAVQRIAAYYGEAVLEATGGQPPELARRVARTGQRLEHLAPFGP